MSHNSHPSLVALIARARSRRCRSGEWQDLQHVMVVTKDPHKTWKGPVLSISRDLIWLTFILETNQIYKPIYYVTSPDSSNFSCPIDTNESTRIRDCMSELPAAPLLYWDGALSTRSTSSLLTIPRHMPMRSLQKSGLNPLPDSGPLLSNTMVNLFSSPMQRRPFGQCLGRNR